MGILVGSPGRCAVSFLGTGLKLRGIRIVVVVLASAMAPSFVLAAPPRLGGEVAVVRARYDVSAPGRTAHYGTRLGPEFGVGASWALAPYTAMEVSTRISSRGSRLTDVVNGVDGVVTKQAEYLALRTLVRRDLAQGVVVPYVALGADLSYLLRSKYRVESRNLRAVLPDASVRDWDWGVVGAVGVEKAGGSVVVGFRVTYLLGMYNTADVVDTEGLSRKDRLVIVGLTLR